MQASLLYASERTKKVVNMRSVTNMGVYIFVYIILIVLP